MVDHTTLSGNESNELFCSDCDTDEHILQISGTDIEVVNSTGVDSAHLRCTECGADGSYKQMPDGTMYTDGRLFGDGDQ